MLSASLIDSSGSPSYGAYRVLAPLPDIQTNNLSHIYEVYQNLPQLGKPIILPVNYRPPDQQQYYRSGLDYENDDNSPISKWTSPHSHSKPVTRNNVHFIATTKQAESNEDENDGMFQFQRRDG